MTLDDLREAVSRLALPRFLSDEEKYGYGFAIADVLRLLDEHQGRQRESAQSMRQPVTCHRCGAVVEVGHALYSMNGVFCSMRCAR